jgi:response regulator NasT
MQVRGVAARLGPLSTGLCCESAGLNPPVGDPRGAPRPPENLSPMPKNISIVVVEKDRERAHLIVDSLREAGDYDIHVVAEESGLARRISERNPDVVLVDVASPSRDMLEELTLASSPMERPVAIFVDRSEDGLTKAAIEAGVSAYVVDGLRADRIKPIMDAAIARFHMFQRMRLELETTKLALEERKVIDRAKGILMKARGIGEDDAYALLRKTAMDQGRKVAEVASALVTAAGLLS